MLSRRRFLTIAACAVATPAFADETHEWSGEAMGSAARIVLTGCDGHAARRMFRKVEAVIAQVEGHFSLHRESELARLNRLGRLAHPDAAIVDLFDVAGAVHDATGGAFDPSIQPLWLATALGGDVAAARALAGWPRVRVSAEEIRLDPGMALTFNGIAQGHAADRVATLMRRDGFRDVLVHARRPNRRAHLAQQPCTGDVVAARHADRQRQSAYSEPQRCSGPVAACLRLRTSGSTRRCALHRLLPHGPACHHACARGVSGRAPRSSRLAA
jgi:hypothetical protein